MKRQFLVSLVVAIFFISKLLLIRGDEVRSCPDDYTQLKIDFDRDGSGNIIPSGTLIVEQYLPYVSFDCVEKGEHRYLVALDSENPPEDDLDLGTPNKDFGGKGEGTGGRRTNKEHKYNIMIVQDPNTPISNPNDNNDGGDITLSFPKALLVQTVSVLDVDDREFFLFFTQNAKGENTSLRVPQNLGSNGYQLIEFYQDDVKWLKLYGEGSFAIVEINVCIPNPDLVCVESKTCACDHSSAKLESIEEARKKADLKCHERSIGCPSSYNLVGDCDCTHHVTEKCSSICPSGKVFTVESDCFCECKDCLCELSL